MGATISRSYMCCALRDKGMGEGFSVDRTPQFQCLELDVQLEQPVMVALAPLHQREGASRDMGQPRRIAIASQQEVHVYQLLDTDLPPGESPTLLLTHSLKLDRLQMVAGIIFSDEDNSRSLVVALGRTANDHGKDHYVRVWSCETAVGKPNGDVPKPVIEWKSNEGFLYSLDEHRARVTHLVSNKTYLLTADAAGECRLWRKNPSYTRRGAATLHSGGIADIVVDRLFAYSTGVDDRTICAWSFPDLQQVWKIPVDIPDDLLSGMMPSSALNSRRPSITDPAPLPVAAPALSGPGSGLVSGSRTPPGNKIARLNLLRRPLSRWAGWQGSSRGGKVPRGSLFLAGVLADGCEVAGAGAGVLMEWSMGDKPRCQNVQIAHDSPIIALVYGPYDNGPLITADAKGVFRVWEFLLEKGLCFSQQVDLMCPLNSGGICDTISVAVEQPRSLYVVAGVKRLFVWQRHQDGSSSATKI